MKYAKRWQAHGMGAIAAVGLLFAATADAYTLWSTEDLQLGPGTLYGPGNDPVEHPLFPMVVRRIMFLNATDAMVPFAARSGEAPSMCAKGERPRERLTNGLAVNANIDACALSLDGRNIAVAVVDGGPHRGREMLTLQGDGNLVVTADLALDFGDKVVRLPFYATTGTVTVPHSPPQRDGHADRAGKYIAGTALTGRIGDFNGDGWIDGTLVAAGVMPLDSPVRPGQAYIMRRNFETNIPAAGVLSGNIHALQRGARTP